MLFLSVAYRWHIQKNTLVVVCLCLHLSSYGLAKALGRCLRSSPEHFYRQLTSGLYYSLIVTGVFKMVQLINQDISAVSHPPCFCIITNENANRRRPDSGRHCAVAQPSTSGAGALQVLSPCLVLFCQRPLH